MGMGSDQSGDSSVSVFGKTSFLGGSFRMEVDEVDDSLSFVHLEDLI